MPKTGNGSKKAVIGSGKDHDSSKKDLHLDDLLDHFPQSLFISVLWSDDEEPCTL
jgi:hypothetical protein